MALRKLVLSDTGEMLCPICSKPLNFRDGGAVRVIDGRLDMENIKPKYECQSCGVYFREFLKTGYFDEFPNNESNTSDEEESSVQRAAEEIDAGNPVSLKPSEDGTVNCPHCQRKMDFIEGGPVRIVHGKLDMENVKARYECDHCGLVYREVLNSKYYLPTKMSNCRHKIKSGKNKLLPTGDLTPLLLKKDENGQCVCPRCQGMMNYVEGQPVRLVDGKPDMENVWDHFKCPQCQSVYRRIVQTDYFQWTEK